MGPVTLSLPQLSSQLPWGSTKSTPVWPTWPLGPQLVGSIVPAVSRILGLDPYWHLLSLPLPRILALGSAQRRRLPLPS